ncbi:hypothetical protein B5M42_022335 [Paenibacillus athensensis]|uniref:Glutamine amidotransferase domain-containing protein n=1 Tax=Paenibacillus athensensis TaxID=1967502 RepID=A0A4Y8PU00_9BACL|nr:hypothetical protein [Paenibacillus athensensis]MCD1261545.1 hypothetical protein [Paenibacillus athensensis]
MYVKFQRFYKACLSGCLALGLLGVGASGVAAAAEPQLHIEAQPGLAAPKVKEGAWLPVRFTLSNPGADLEGDLVVRIGRQGSGQPDFSYKQHVELPQGGVKTVAMLLPGIVYTKESNHIAFYEHSVEDGSEVAATGDTALEVSMTAPTALQVGVLAAGADTLNFLALLNADNRQVDVLHVQAADMPDNALALHNLDVLAINDFASDTLTPAQLQAIARWVEQGGELLLAGGAGFPKTAGPFAGLSPVTYTGTAAVTALTALAEAGGKPLNLSVPFTVSLAKPVAGALIDVQQDGQLLAAHRAYGSGTVGYVAYDLALDPLASWPGNAGLWERLLADRLPNGANNVIINRMGPYPSFWQLDNALDYFPQLKPPKLGVLSLVLLAYAIIVGPLLYLVLRKWDRREWAWVVIPALAVLTSIGIFQFGISSRGSMLAQQLNTVELNGTGQAVQRTALALFVPKGGSPELGLPGVEAAQPLSSAATAAAQRLGSSNGWTMSTSGTGASIQLHRVPYSSISKTVTGERTLPAAGTLDFTLKSSAPDKLSGVVTNHTQQQLLSVGLLINNKWLQIGDLAPGASANVEASGGSYVSDPSSLADLMFPYGVMQNSDTNVREKALLTDYFYNRNAGASLIPPAVFGFVRESGSDLTVDGHPVRSEQISLWVQPVSLQFAGEDGRIFIPGTALAPIITSTEMTAGAIDYQDGQRVHLSSGQLIFEYRLPQLPGAEYSRLQLESENNNAVTLKLWNAQTAAWEALEPGAKLVVENDKLQPFIQEGVLRMQAATTQQDVWLTFPAFSLEGAVQR